MNQYESVYYYELNTSIFCRVVFWKHFLKIEKLCLERESERQYE